MRSSDFHRHHGFYLALAAGVAIGALALLSSLRLSLIAGLDTFFVVFLALAIRTLRTRQGESLRAWARSEDAPPVLMFLTSALAAAVALFYLFRQLYFGGPSHALTLAFALALAAIPLGWATVHMMAALHYARLYFFGIEEGRNAASAKAAPDVASGGHRHRKRAGSGLEFPGGSQVSGWDFVYFAFVIGMTAQTSDVGISAGEIRRFALLHSILSFFLNTVLLAAAVNIVVTLKP